MEIASENDALESLREKEGELYFVLAICRKDENGKWLTEEIQWVYSYYHIVKGPSEEVVKFGRGPDLTPEQIRKNGQKIGSNTTTLENPQVISPQPIEYRCEQCPCRPPPLLIEP